jgi:hypothetical protein
MGSRPKFSQVLTLQIGNFNPNLISTYGEKRRALLRDNKLCPSCGFLVGFHIPQKENVHFPKLQSVRNEFFFFQV